MIIVTFFSNVFGVNNGIVGVVTVIALMTFRFANLDFKTGQSAITILGILGGLMVGFSGTYPWQTSFNCFGALTAAVPVFGLG